MICKYRNGAIIDDGVILNACVSSKFVIIDPKAILGESGIFKKNNNANNFVRVKHIDGSYRCGFYYRCCWPCCCDIMNENVVDVVVEDIDLKLKDGTFKYPHSFYLSKHLDDKCETMKKKNTPALRIIPIDEMEQL